MKSKTCEHCRRRGVLRGSDMGLVGDAFAGGTAGHALGCAFCGSVLHSTSS